MIVGAATGYGDDGVEDGADGRRGAGLGSGSVPGGRLVAVTLGDFVFFAAAAVIIIVLVLLLR